MLKSVWNSCGHQHNVLLQQMYRSVLTAICRDYTFCKFLNQMKELKKGHSSEDKRPRNPSLRWGIAPVSLIADDFVKALSLLPKEKHQVVACVAPYCTQLCEFAKRHKIPKAFTNFHDFARCKDIDVVYISALSPFQLELGRLMLDHGKNILCESSFCMNEDQAVQLIGHAHYKGRFLMEGMWTRFMPAYQHMRQQIKEGAIGDIKEIKCDFGWPMLDLERVVKLSLGGGVTKELGIYPLQLALWAFRAPPLDIIASGELNEYGVDVKTKIELDYGSGRVVKINLAADKQDTNEAVITGEKGTLTIPEFFGPTKLIDQTNECISFANPKHSEIHTNYAQRLSMSYQADEVFNCLIKKKKQSDRWGHNESLIVARIIDEIRKQVGVIYAEDLPKETSNRRRQKHMR